VGAGFADPDERQERWYAPLVDGEAIGTHVRKESSASGSVPRRARALVIATWEGTEYCSVPLVVHDSPSVTLCITSSYPEEEDSIIASTQ